MRKLFTEPFDLSEIERTLEDEDFLSLAHFTVGLEENWRVGLDQVARLLPIFEEAGSSLPIYGLISILIGRTGQRPEPEARLAEANARLGLLPGRRTTVALTSTGRATP